MSQENEPISHLRDHIEIIAKHEQEFLARRTKSERLADSLGTFIGSSKFVVVNACLFAAWLLFNTLQLGVPHFDPFPFQFLDTLVAIEAIFLASFIVMRQSRQGRRSEERNHLILQILMLTEKEITAVLNVERQLAARLGLREVSTSVELEQLGQKTPIDELAQFVKEDILDE